MREARFIARVVAVWGLAFAFCASAASPAQGIFTVDFKVMDGYMAVVPVSIDGRGPFRFLLDTGASRTMIGNKTADEVGLRRVAAGVIASANGNAVVSLVHCGSVSVGGVTVLDLDLTALSGNTGLPPGLDGVLGEDFLEGFDVLIDNRHHRIELERGPGRLADALTGERLPVRLGGMADEGPTRGRLILTCHAPDLSNGEISLLLDSGANSLMLFGGRRSLGVEAVEQTYLFASSSASLHAVSASTQIVRQIRFGSRLLSNVVAVAPPAVSGADTDGLLPTAFFHSIFISHSQRYIILDPSRMR